MSSKPLQLMLDLPTNSFENYRTNVLRSVYQILETYALTVFSDASHATLHNGESQVRGGGGGVIVFLQSEKGKSSPLTWTSQKL